MRALAGALPHCAALQTLECAGRGWCVRLLATSRVNANTVVARVPGGQAVWGVGRGRAHSLAGNNIGADGALSLAGALPQCAAIQRLGCARRVLRAVAVTSRAG